MCTRYAHTHTHTHTGIPNLPSFAGCLKRGICGRHEGESFAVGDLTNS